MEAASAEGEPRALDPRIGPRVPARAMIRAFFMTHISGSPSGHRHTERIAPRWCWLAPHTRASACTRACTLYGCAARAPHGNDESSTLEHLASGPRFLPLRPARESFSRFLTDSPRVAPSLSVALPLNPACRAARSLSLGRTRAAMCGCTCVHAWHGRARVCVRT